MRSAVAFPGLSWSRTFRTRAPVRFTSAYTEAEAVRKKVGDRPTTCTEPFNFVRKMACPFGWDWGSTLVTAGMWRPACPDRDSARPPPRMDVEVVPTATGCQVMITARTLIRDLLPARRPAAPGGRRRSGPDHLAARRAPHHRRARLDGRTGPARRRRALRQPRRSA
ncbi:glycosyl hydrolase 2 galactose-binding domain-containing protein [Streptosporangium sp. NPDC003464]